MIDKDGKLFGLINIIDLLVLIVIVGIIIFGVRRMDGPQTSVRETTSGQVIYEIQNIRQVTVDSINVGDELYHYDKGVYIGDIVDVQVEPYVEQLRYEDQWLMAEVPDKYTVLVTVEGDIEESNEFYTVGQEQTRVGGQYRLKNKNFTAFGTCFGVEVDS